MHLVEDGPGLAHPAAGGEGAEEGVEVVDAEAEASGGPDPVEAVAVVEHYETVQTIKQTLECYRELCDIAGILRLDKFSKKIVKLLQEHENVSVSYHILSLWQKSFHLLKYHIRVLICFKTNQSDLYVNTR